MRAVQMSRYGGPEVLELRDDVREPSLRDEDVLVRVHASSVNPIDAHRRGGYGKALFERKGAGLPQIPGRDVSGTVERLGPRAGRFAVGDAVWAAQDALRDGTHAEYVAIREQDLDPRPDRLSHVEAGTIPYVAATTFAALSGTRCGKPETADGTKVLVHAGAGGIGSFAIQLLKAWGATVATTCSTRNVDLCRSLGADLVFDYSQVDYAAELGEQDVVYDTLGDAGGEEERSLSVLRRGGEYVSIVHPLMSLIDRFGLLLGGAAAGATFVRANVRERVAGGRSYRWALFQPSAQALATVRELVEAGRIRPVIEGSYPLAELAQAHRHIETGRTRGKIAISVAGTPGGGS